MAQGTAGLGQDSTVFDFSNIGRQGLMLDEVKYQANARFKKDNIDLYNDIDDSFIRDVDAPFLNQQVEEYMELATEAISSKDPATLQKAKNMRAEVSRLTATSRAARKHGTDVMSAFRASDEYARGGDKFETFYSQQQEATAMTSNNKGQVGEAILFQAPQFYNLENGLDHYADRDAPQIIKGGVETISEGSSRRDGTGSSSSLKAMNETNRGAMIRESYEAGMSSDVGFQDAVLAQVMSDYYGTTDLSQQQVASFYADREYGEELRSVKGEFGFTSEEEIKADARFSNNPVQQRRALHAFNLENRIDERGFNLYNDAVMARTNVGQTKSTKVDGTPNSDGGGGIKASDLMLNNGKSVKSVLGNVSIVAGGMPEALQSRIDAKGSSLGYANAPKTFASGSGNERIVTGGVVASRDAEGKIVNFVVEYKPSPDVLKKMDRGEDISDWLVKMDASFVPLQEAKSRVPQGILSMLVKEANKQAALDLL